MEMFVDLDDLILQDNNFRLKYLIIDNQYNRISDHLKFLQLHPEDFDTLDTDFMQYLRDKSVRENIPGQESLLAAGATVWVFLIAVIGVITAALVKLFDALSGSSMETGKVYEETILSWTEYRGFTSYDNETMKTFDGSAVIRFVGAVVGGFRDVARNIDMWPKMWEYNFKGPKDQANIDFKWRYKGSDFHDDYVKIQDRVNAITRPQKDVEESLAHVAGECASGSIHREFNECIRRTRDIQVIIKKVNDYLGKCKNFFKKMDQLEIQYREDMKNHGWSGIEYDPEIGQCARLYMKNADICKAALIKLSAHKVWFEKACKDLVLEVTEKLKKNHERARQKYGI